MIVRQHPSASAELVEAMAWYADRSPIAAEKFWLSLQSARKNIVAFPLAAPKADINTRRFVLRDYPYDLIYHVRDNEIFIVAYAHHKRRPGYWKARLRNNH